MVVIAVIAIAAGVYWLVSYKIPYDNAVKTYDSAVASLEQKNSELDVAIGDLTTLAASEDKPLSDDASAAVSDAIGKAQAAKESAPEMPKDVDSINATAAEIEEMGDYSNILEKLSDAKTEYENSVKQMKQVTNPTEAFVIQRIQTVPTVTGVEAVSEGNDPNGQLNKSGWYTATVYFRSNMVNISKVHKLDGYTDVVGYGNSGGGAIEVYRTVDDAKARVNYLAQSDQTLIGGDSHEVIGTCVVRTSRYLTASQQNELTENLIAALTRLE